MAGGTGSPVRRPKIPWKAIFGSVPIWGLIFGEIGHDLLYFMVVTNLPKYMSDVLKYNIHQAGLIMALPFVALWFTGFISGFSADFLIARGFVSVLFIRKVYTFIGCVGPSLCCLAVPYMGCHQMWAAAMVIIGMATMGPYYPGLRVNGIDLSTNFSGIIMAVVNGSGALFYFPVPYWIGHVTTNHTVAEWKLVFWVISASSIGLTVFYMFMAKADRQEWDYVETTT